MRGRRAFGRAALILLGLAALPSPGRGSDPAGRIAADLERLCGAGPRTGGSPALAGALEHVAARLARAGVDRLWREPVTVPRWDGGGVELLVDGTGEVLRAHLLYPSPAPPSGSHPLAPMGWGTPDAWDRAPLLPPGRMVLVHDGVPPGMSPVHRSEKARRAAVAGAVALLLASPAGEPVRGAVAFDPPAPLPVLSVADPRGLLDSLCVGGVPRVRVREDPRPRLRRTPGRDEEIHALLAGSGRNGERILLSAHLDAWDVGAGALDNAAGVAVLLEAVRRLAGRSGRDRDIEIVVRVGEEVGLMGSRAHAAACRRGERPWPAVVLNLEMCEAPAGFVLHAGAALRPVLARLVLENRDLGLSAGVQERLDLYSDHLPFLVEGVPSIALAYHRSEDADRRAHTSADLPGRLDPAGLARSAVLVAACLERLGAGSTPLPARLDEAALRSLDPELLRLREVLR
jgi:hypothetical protein